MRTRMDVGWEDAFWSSVREDESGCWVWSGSRQTDGYGRFHLDGRAHQAHRIAHELVTGVVPAHLEIDHLCRNRACCNPAHLEAVTHRENTLRGDTIAATNAAKTHCPRGHALSGENVYVRPDRFARCCRTCRREQKRKVAA